MKKLVIVSVLIIPILCFAQFKEQSKLPAFSQIIAKPSASILGFINPDKFNMHHSVSFNYMSFGGHGLMVNSYMNTIDYQISNPLSLRLNLGLMNSPYNSFDNSALDNTKFFGGAELLYRMSENSALKIGVDVRPGFYSPYRYNDWYGW